MARRNRLPTRRVLGAGILLFLVGAAVLLLRDQRPGLDVYAPVEVVEASVGVPYVVDEQLCLTAPLGGTVREVRGTGTRDGLTTALLLPPAGAPPVIAFPVRDAAGRDPVGTRVDGLDGPCLRLVLTAEREDTFRAPELEVVVAYGPGGVLRRTLTVTPPTTLEVVRTGPDPRLAAP